MHNIETKLAFLTLVADEFKGRFNAFKQVCPPTC